MNALDERLKGVEEEIKTVEVLLAAVELELVGPDPDIAYLRKKEEQLRDEKRLILELILRQSPGI
jgi:septal ring factor EnvC (AmiA/AmiB activator)